MGSLAAVAAAAFHAADPAAALLLLPFVGWTCFATALVNCALASGNAEVLATLMFAPAVVICTGLLSSAQRPSVAHWHAPASAFKRRCSLPAHIDLLPKGSMMRDACSRSNIYADVAARVPEWERGCRRRSLIWPATPRPAPAGGARRTEPGGAEVRRGARSGRRRPCHALAVRGPGRGREGAQLLQGGRDAPRQPCPSAFCGQASTASRKSAVQSLFVKRHMCMRMCMRSFASPSAPVDQRPRPTGRPAAVVVCAQAGARAPATHPLIRRTGRRSRHCCGLRAGAGARQQGGACAGLRRQRRACAGVRQ